MGLANDKILSVDGEYIDNFFQIQLDILLNDRKISRWIVTVSLNIDIPRSTSPLLCKGQQIDARVPFSPLLLPALARSRSVMPGCSRTTS